MSPVSNYVCLVFLLLIVGVMLLTPGMQLSAYAMPVWLVVVYVAYRLRASRALLTSHAPTE